MKYPSLKILAACVVSSCFSVSALAGQSDFHKGTLISNFGEVARVQPQFYVPF